MWRAIPGLLGLDAGNQIKRLLHRRKLPGWWAASLAQNARRAALTKPCSSESCSTLSRKPKWPQGFAEQLGIGFSIQLGHFGKSDGGFFLRASASSLSRAGRIILKNADRFGDVPVFDQLSNIRLQRFSRRGCTKPLPTKSTARFPLSGTAAAQNCLSRNFAMGLRQEARFGSSWSSCAPENLSQVLDFLVHAVEHLANRIDFHFAAFRTAPSAKRIARCSASFHEHGLVRLGIRRFAPPKPRVLASRCPARGPGNCATLRLKSPRPQPCRLAPHLTFPKLVNAPRIPRSSSSVGSPRPPGAPPAETGKPLPKTRVAPPSAASSGPRACVACPTAACFRLLVQPAPWTENRLDLVPNLLDLRRPVRLVLGPKPPGPSATRSAQSWAQTSWTSAARSRLRLGFRKPSPLSPGTRSTRFRFQSLRHPLAPLGCGN